MIGNTVDRWRECATEPRTVGMSCGRDLLCSTVPLSHSSHRLSSLLLSVVLPCLCFGSFCSPPMLSVAILDGYKDGQCSYISLKCGIASTLPWLGVFVFEWGERRREELPLWEKKGHRDRELWRSRAWLRSTVTRHFYYLHTDNDSQSTPLVRVRELSVKIPLPEMQCLCFTRRTSVKREQLGAVISRSGGNHFRGCSLCGGIAVQSQLISMMSEAVAASLHSL